MTRLDKVYSLIPVFQYFVIDWNSLKQQSKRAKPVIQIATETIGNGDKRKLTSSTVHARAHSLSVRVFFVCIA